MLNEAQYQRRLIQRLRRLLPGCVILKNDPSYVQGMPDLIILYQDMWAMLETKITPNARRQPNQDYYVKLLREMSFASFIDPDNEEDVIRDLQLAFRAIRQARLSEPE